MSKKTTTTKIDILKDGMGEHEGQVECLVASNMSPEVAASMRNVTLDSLREAARRMREIAFPTKGELAAKIRATLTRTAQEQAMPIHRDVLHYFTEALAEALYVAPPVDPEDVKGVG